MWLFFVAALFAGLSTAATWSVWDTETNMKYMALLGTILLLLSILAVFFTPEYQVKWWAITMIVLGVLLSGAGWKLSMVSRVKPLKRAKSIQEFLLTPQSTVSGSIVTEKNDILTKLRREGLSEGDRKMLIHQLEKLTQETKN